MPPYGHDDTDRLLQQAPFVELWVPRYQIPFISENKGHAHWSQLARARKDWGQLTMAALSNLRTKPPFPWPVALVVPTFSFRTRRRRDPINFMPTLKPIIDWLVDVGAWPDDNPEWVDYGTPAEKVNAASTEGVLLTIYDRNHT